MNIIRKYSTLASAALLILLLAAAQYRGGRGARPALLAPPSVPAVTAFKVETKGGFILVAQMLAKPARPPKIRGMALRDKGEALGGGAPDRVDKSTETPAAQ
ncbi:MAG: hypothetical protein PHS14_01895 [Elusimicrobia bacterium]|nr:hypothetical protein [Elusimicrobiota bacterium]